MKRAITATVALLALLVLAMPATGVAGKGKKAKVTVNDDYFSTGKLTVKKNTKVSFKWDKDNLDLHNVWFESGPKGVKRSGKKGCAKGSITKCNVSATGSIGVNFAPTFDKKGTYKFVCRIHPDLMKLTVKVKG